VTASLKRHKGHAIRWITVFCLAGLVASSHAGTRQIEGRIAGVTDGDTITLLDADSRQHKVRLDGIDAPELGQPFGRASKQHLAELLASREAVAECSKTDRYGRKVCRVMVGGTDTGLEQIRAGMAWYFRRYADELPPDRRQHYADGEAQAKDARRGLWADAEPVPPRDWRLSRSPLSSAGPQQATRSSNLQPGLLPNHWFGARGQVSGTGAIKPP